MSRCNGVFVHGHQNLVDIVKVEIFSEDGLRQLFDKPLLLMVVGDRRRELSSLEVYQSYSRRFDIEHLFRFLKQKLLFCGYQTVTLERQVGW